uniref:H(+)-exporting diphosphatase n=1 Tax=Tanacetum cinerariifolium TaxID=118510 RepID=A0A6L2MJB5_TANCI|nr:vacuolar H+-pyrophosphatase [Tanacetum cinerariifolium]
MLTSMTMATGVEQTKTFTLCGCKEGLNKKVHAMIYKLAEHGLRCKVADGYGTHPALCISELMRILMDVKGISWKGSKVVVVSFYESFEDGAWFKDGEGIDQDMRDVLIWYIDAYGPINDDDGGISEMADVSHRIRERTKALDAAGITTAAIGNAFSAFDVPHERWAKLLGVRDCKEQGEQPEFKDHVGVVVTIKSSGLGRKGTLPLEGTPSVAKTGPWKVNVNRSRRMETIMNSFIIQDQ